MGKSLLLFCLGMILIVAIIWLGSTYEPPAVVVTVREATPLEKRVAKLEAIAHKAPWWLADDMKGVE